MADDPLIGQQLDEYRIEALLGQGGMARVYRGFDTRLERWVAIKVIETSFQSDADYMARFEREARAIAQLEHPHIVSVYRYGEANGVLYMAMRYIEGSAFDRMLMTYHQEGDFIPVAEARQIIQQICMALDYAHSRKVIHRDVKPGNIMIDKQGNAYLTDFGLVLLTDVGTRGEIFGTPHYIAPEQAISSAGVVPQSDLYAMGVILFEVFTGQVPFEAESAMDVAMMHMTEPPPPPRQLRPDLSPEVEAVILKALEKEPTDRYPTGAALLAALDQALKARMQVALPLPTAEKSIFQRVAVDLAERPLPLMPVGVTPPPPAAFPEPVKRPEGNLAAAQPVGAGAASLKGAAGPQGRSLLFAGLGIGAILITGFLLLLLGIGLFLWLRSNNPDEAAQATPSAPVAPAAIAETPSTASDGDALPTATLPPAPVEEALPTATLPPQATNLPTAVPAAVVVPPEPAVAEPIYYELLIATRKDESMLIVNQGANPFPMARLRLVGKKGGVDAASLGEMQLQQNECIALYKNRGKPKFAETSCNEPMLALSLEPNTIFWKDGFEVYYSGQELEPCEDERCVVSFQVMESEPNSLQIIENQGNQEDDDDE